MISSLRLENFQSHNLTQIEFSPGINAIVGISNSGKSALMRGIELVRTNRPTGTAYISDWAFDKEGKQKDPCRVTLVSDGNKVERVRVAKQNGYIVNGVLTEAIKTDVPDAVTTALNLDDLNIQKQLDGPFLLSKSGPEVARFFNSLVNLEEIDHCMSAADGMRREVARDIKRDTEAREKAQHALDGLGWVEGARASLDRLTALKADQRRIQERLETYRSAMRRRVRSSEIIAQYTWVPKVEESIRNLRDCEKIRRDIVGRQDWISIASNRRKEAAATLAKWESLPALESGLAEYRKTLNRVAGVSLRYDALMDILNRRKAHQATLAKYTWLESVDLSGIRAKLKERAEIQARIQAHHDSVAKLHDAQAKQADAQNRIDYWKPVVGLDLAKLTRLVTMRAEKTERRARVRSLIGKRTTSYNDIERLTREIAEVEATLPAKCPSCGRREPHED